jgi:transcriptional regulator with XRE-family HTH domain
MKLLQYLKDRKLSDEEFAEMVGGSATARAVRKWKYGETSPRIPELVRVEEVTGGAVTARDFLDDAERTDAERSGSPFTSEVA